VLLDLLLLGRRERIENEIFLAAPKQENHYTTARSSEKLSEMKRTNFETVDTQSPKCPRLAPPEAPTVAPVLLDSTLSAPSLSTRGCNPANLYQRLNLIEEGSYGLVYRAQHLPSSEIVAMKKIKFEKNSPGFPITALREISSLLALDHPNIVRYREVVVGKTHRE
jgi:serine/threonine protein kinase